MTEYPGEAERALAADLTARLPTESATLRWHGVDLRSSAEHLLYVALRRPATSASGGRVGTVRPMARLAREAAAVLARRTAGSREAIDIAILVTQPVHATLFAPVAALLPEHVGVVLVDARTGGGLGRARLPMTSDALTAHLSRTFIPSLAGHAVAVRAELARPPRPWTGVVGPAEAERLTGILRRGLPLVALDAARVASLAAHRRPPLIACFSESGLLARIVPAVAATRPEPPAVVDLPHAEAADPWGTVGAAYDGVAVYGPRAARVMALAGITEERIAEVGPLRYDALLSRQPVAPRESPRRLVLASQPADPSKRAIHPDVKRAVLRAAIGAAAAIGPCEVSIVPHPTESDPITDEFLAEAVIPANVQVRVKPRGTLHDTLSGAWVLVTGSSQSVFDAVLSGVPAITVNATGGEDPVTFAREGIALGASSVEEAVAVAERLADPARRSEAVRAAREALGDRLGPLDGKAAARTAEWLLRFVERISRKE